MALKDHLNKLEYFCAVVDAKSILKASLTVGVTQPQLSRVVKQLENDLDKQLLVRTPSGVELTKDGLELYKASTHIVEKIQSVEKKIKHGNKNVKGQIRIGTYDSIGRYFFPSFLKYIKAALPKVEINLETGRSSDIYTRLINDKIDVAICVYQNFFNTKGVTIAEVYSDSFGFYHHPSTLAAFKDQIIVFPGAMGSQNETSQGFIKKYKFRTQILSDNLETVKSLSEEAVGVGLLPHRVAREAVLQGKLISSREKVHKKDLFPHKIVVCKKINPTSESLDSLMEELHRFLSSWSKN